MEEGLKLGKIRSLVLVKGRLGKLGCPRDEVAFVRIVAAEWTQEGFTRPPYGNER